MAMSFTQRTYNSFFVQIILFAVIIMLSGKGAAYGQKDVVLTFQHKKSEKRTRQLVFHQNFNYLAIETKDTTIIFTSTIPYLSDSTITKLKGRESYSIPIDDILVIKKGKDYVKSMGQIVLTLSVVPLIAGGVYWITGDSEEALNGLIFSAALATLSLPVIVIGALRSKYNMKRWELVSIEERQVVRD